MPRAATADRPHLQRQRAERLAGGQATDGLGSGFEGTLRDGEVDGQIDGQALLGSVPVQLSSAIALLEKERRLGALNFTAGGATISGDLVQSVATGLYQGQLKLAAPDVSTAAALVLMRASGSLMWM